MLKFSILIFSLLLSTFTPGIEFKKIDIEKLTRSTPFNVFVPTKFESATSFEIKEPSQSKNNTELIIINYFNKNSYTFGIREQRNNSYVTSEMEVIDLKSKTQITKRIKKKVVMDNTGEIVKINNIEGRYEPYDSSGGLLKWIQSGTYIEIDSSKLSKDSMIRIAESMKKLT